MNLSKIHHIAIIVSDYEAAKDFYVNKLGFSVIRENYRPERKDWKLDSFFCHKQSPPCLIVAFRAILHGIFQKVALKLWHSRKLVPFCGKNVQFKINKVFFDSSHLCDLLKGGESCMRVCAGRKDRLHHYKVHFPICTKYGRYAELRETASAV